MAGAKKTADGTAEAEALYARAGKESAIAEILRDLHEGLRLWRRCARKQCRRARSCCGDPVACGAHRWPTAMACLRAMKARQGEPVARVADRKALLSVGTKKVIFEWRKS